MRKQEAAYRDYLGKSSDWVQIALTPQKHMPLTGHVYHANDFPHNPCNDTARHPPTICTSEQAFHQTLPTLPHLPPAPSLSSHEITSSSSCIAVALVMVSETDRES